MKKIFYYTLAAFSLFFIGNIDVFALEMKADEIGNATYVIGTHMFTREKNESTGYDGKLTTERLMLASKTIEGNSLGDMRVYYKNPRGVWTNGITGEQMSAPEIFNIEYVDSGELLRTPIIEETGMGGVVGVNWGISFNVDDYDGAQEVEVYYATSEDGEYELLEKLAVADIPENGVSVSAPSGYHYYFKVKLVKTSDGIISRSEYSNVLDVDCSFNGAPVISRKAYGLNDSATGENKTALGVESLAGLVEIYYATSKDGEYQLYGEASFGNEETGDFDVTIPLGSHYYFKARYVSADGKVFSDYSNVVDIDNSLHTPTIEETGTGGVVGVNWGISFSVDDYAGAQEVEIYRSTSEDGEYELLETVVVADIPENGIYVSSPSGYHYYFKVKLVRTVDGVVIRSEYSNVLDVDCSFNGAPVISRKAYGLNDPATGENKTALGVESLAGLVEIYYATREDGEYQLYGEASLGNKETGDFDVTIPLGSHYYFKARYVSVDGKVFSDYSNVVDIDNSLHTPVISKDGFGVDGITGATGFMLGVDDYSYADHMEIYYATSEAGEYQLYDNVVTADILEIPVSLNVPYGYHYYFKVRLSKTVGEQVIYSDYSNVIDHDNSLRTPVISHEFSSVTVEGYYLHKINVDGDMDFVDGVVIDYSVTEDFENLTFTYILAEDVLEQDGIFKDVPLGEKHYYRVRFYKYIKSEDKYIYSDYSNVISIESQLPTPTIYEELAGGDENGGVAYILNPDTVATADGIEIYAATSEDGEYEFKLFIPADEIMSTPLIIPAGEHYYFKVRLRQNVNGNDVYSDYSNVIEIDNTNN